jgi:hypothetical protein
VSVQDGEHPGCQVPVGGERGEASDWQIRVDDAWSCQRLKRSILRYFDGGHDVW